ncbi:RNA-binding cell elongation regulator Jag/EloR [Effusibacillus lacus]|uniref:RNA-binding protein KhpB n=1 Tax=Effusibacillus lacus TaxID=1348429 RepID=A0A292YJR3_9BACL|nr:RNA-binding cell elongation regulator Jag/EloR [Effusibacillus lacus]TCS75194.1 spoIIIJ-associated protein [Effusibacillus lacus]GAX89139.1 protein jag [Effusibacillus lacus]
MRKVIATGKTIEDAIQVALEKLGVARDQVEVRVLTQPSRGLFGLIGSRDAEIEAIVKDAPVAEEISSGVGDLIESDPTQSIANAHRFLQDVIRAMGLNADVKISEDSEGHYLFEIEGDRLGILIGKRGQTLDALQYLVNLVANKHSETFLRIVLDAEEYRSRRKETLERLADRLAKQVMREKQEIELEPMPAYERKVIHSYLQGHARVATRSVGEEPNRKVLIYLK